MAVEGGGDGRRTRPRSRRTTRSRKRRRGRGGGGMITRMIGRGKRKFMVMSETYLKDDEDAGEERLSER